jgi:tetratricopeptide (TPR) repeat protein
MAKVRRDGLRSNDRGGALCAAAAMALALAAVGCGGAAMGSAAGVKPAAAAPFGQLTPAAQSKVGAALRAMAAHDKARDWSAAACAEVAARFLEADAPGAPVPSYDAGLARARCGDEGASRALFEAALERDPSFFPARAALARARARSGSAGLDRAIADVEAAVVASRFSDANALVLLGTLQSRRGRPATGPGDEGDLARARGSLQRALAIDDGSVAALDQLALTHLAAARGAAKKGDAQALELGRLVCSQAALKDPAYAPIHNTAGLIEVALGNLPRAVTEFGEARRLDPASFEAQMNFAALNLGFHGYAPAEEAYRAALALRPDDYDARLGLSLALRAQIDEVRGPALVPEAERELVKAKSLAPERPEAYYNEGILAQEYGGRWGADDGERAQALGRARDLFTTFLAKAGDAPSFADARKRASARLEEIDELARFGSSGPAMPKDPGPPPSNAE